MQHKRTKHMDIVFYCVQAAAFFATAVWLYMLNNRASRIIGDYYALRDRHYILQVSHDALRGRHNDLQAKYEELASDAAGFKHFRDSMAGALEGVHSFLCMVQEDMVSKGYKPPSADTP